MDLRNELIKKFKLKSTSSDTAIINAIDEEVTKTTTLRDSLITLLELDQKATDDDILKNIETLMAVMKDFEKEKTEEAKFLVADAVRKGKINGAQKEAVLTMFKANHTQAKAFLQSAPERVTIISQIKDVASKANQESGATPRSEWTIDEYRKFAPVELANDRELYERLVKAKYDKK